MRVCAEYRLQENVLQNRAKHSADKAAWSPRILMHRDASRDLDARLLHDGVCDAGGTIDTGDTAEHLLAGEEQDLGEDRLEGAQVRQFHVLGGAAVGEVRQAGLRGRNFSSWSNSSSISQTAGQTAGQKRVKSEAPCTRGGSVGEVHQARLRGREGGGLKIDAIGRWNTLHPILLLP
jgi:hypothetical protein